MFRLLVIPGSTRRAAYSKQFARAAAGRMPDGVEATVTDLSDHEMPLYDGDFEEEHGLPDGAVSLRKLVQEHDAVLFVSPEYNSSIPAVLKNAIDWLSRPYADEPDVRVWPGKVAGLLSSSPGNLGGMRGLEHLRQVLRNLGVQVVTEQFSLSSANEAFAAGDTLKNERDQKGVDKVVGSVVKMAKALAAG